jgi:hypothetical protein
MPVENNDVYDNVHFLLLFCKVPRGDNLRRPNAIPKGGGERTDQSESAACPPHPLSHTIDMAFGDWSCHLR